MYNDAITIIVPNDYAYIRGVHSQDRRMNIAL